MFGTFCWRRGGHGEVSRGVFGRTPNASFLGYPIKQSPWCGELWGVLVFLGVSEPQVSCFQGPETYTCIPQNQPPERGFNCLEGHL